MRSLWFVLLFPLAIPLAYARGPLIDTASSPHRAAIQELYDRGIVHGYADRTFKPYRPINRAEFLKLLMLAVYGDRAFTIEHTRCFPDFGDRMEWYYPHACVAKNEGIIHGHPDGTFRGENTVNLAEALKMSLEAWNVPIPQYFKAPEHWFSPYIDAAASKGIFRILPLAPGYPLTRSEAAALLVSMDEPLVTLHPDYSDPERIVVDLPVRQIYVPTPASTCGNGILEEGEYCDDGNTADGDGCSSICIVVPEPVYHGALRVEQRPSGSVTVSKGTENVALLAFDAVAGRQDVLITRLKFEAKEGNVSSATNYRLYLDRDRNGAAEYFLATAVPQAGILAFPTLNIFVEDGRYTRVELRADIPLAGSVDDFSVGFATGEPDYVEGVDDIDGRDVIGIETDNGACTGFSICWIAVHTQTPRLIQIGKAEGSLFVTQDTTPVRSHQLLLGALSDNLLRLNLHAIEENIKVEQIAIGGGTDSIDRLELFLEGQAKSFATARKSACSSVATGQFCADTNFVVPKDLERTVLVRAFVNSDLDGGTSGETVTLTLTAATTGVVAVEAEGKSSGTDLSQNDGDSSAEGEVIIGRSMAGANKAIEGQTHNLVGAKIVSIANSHVDPDETAVPVGDATFATFHFRAADHGNVWQGLNNVEIRDIEFTIAATNVQFESGTFELYNSLDPGTAVTCSESATTGVITLTCADLETKSTSTVIAPGGILELSIRGTITDPQVTTGNSTLQAQLKNLGSRTNLDTIIWDDDVFPFQWVDVPYSTVRSTLYRNK